MSEEFAPQTQTPERPLEGADMQALVDQFNEGLSVLTQARSEMLARADRVIANSAFAPLLQKGDTNSNRIILANRDLEGFGYRTPEAIDPAKQTVRYCFQVRYDTRTVDVAIQAALAAGLQVEPRSLIPNNTVEGDCFDSFEVKVPLEVLGQQPAAESPEEAAARVELTTVQTRDGAIRLTGC